MNRRNCFILFISILGISILGVKATTDLVPTEIFMNDISLLPDDRYHLFWKFDEKHITFEVHVATHGYVGFGISSNGGMKGADVIIGWIKDGKPHFHDRWAWREFEPDIDEIQDWELLEANETDTHTVLKFKRPLVTCDTVQDLPITTDATRIIFSFSDVDPIIETGLPYHGVENRGSQTVYLLDENKDSAIPIPDDAIIWDFTMENYTIPPVETTYWCQGFKVPELASKHHAIRFDGVVTEGHESIIHHIILYECAKDIDSNHNYSWECYNDPMAEDLGFDECSAALVGWAIGAGALDFPLDVGLPFGDERSTKYVRLEIHYNNPSMKEGMVDSSGVRMWLTPTLRKYDAGIMSIGVPIREQPSVPWNYQSLTFPGHCSSQCLSEALTEQSDGINLFAVLLHTHYRGKSIKMRHVRNGTELPVVKEDKHYDPNFQEYRLVTPEVNVLPTDDLIVECGYHSEDLSKVTYGGLGGQDEMCRVFVSYYPRVDLTHCESKPDPYRFEALFDGQVKLEYNEQQNYIMIISPQEMYGTPYWYMLEGADWRKESVKGKYQEIVGEGDTMITCRTVKSDYEVHNTKVLLPKITEEYQEVESECIEGEEYEPSGGCKLYISTILTILSSTTYLIL